MKKVEAQALSIERSKLIIEYINQILLDTDKVNGNMNFWYAKIDGQYMCTLDIYVPSKQFEKHLNLGITQDHSLILFRQVLNDLLDFLPHEWVGVSKWRSIKSMQGSFSGVDVTNSVGSKIKINFNTTSPDFMKIVEEYTNKYDEYIEKLNEDKKRLR